MIAALALLLVAAAGHAVIWVAIINRVHATGWPHRRVEQLSKFLFFLLLVPPPAIAAALIPINPESLMPWRAMAPGGSPATAALAGYLVVCWMAAAVVLARRIHWGLHDVSDVLRFHRNRILATSGILHSPDHPHHAIVHLPGNESLALDLTERGLDVPRLPAALEGLSIVHLSDFHLTGKIGRPFFEEIVRMSNALEPEIVAITGDLIDKPEYIDWIPETFGRLKARYGVYFIFGNHDLRVDWRRSQQMMEGLGMIYLGGRSRTIEVRGQPVLVAGNELPWFRPAADLTRLPPRDAVPFRIFLAHSPDQLPWARQGDADLMLAGHTHGGQIRLPLIGPIFAPSMDGVQFASGLFYLPPTILNVSRGLSAELPLRMNCPPEIIHLTLHTGAMKIPLDGESAGAALVSDRE